MNLKDSFRYMNHLSDLFNLTLLELEDFNLLTNTKEVHLRQKSNPSAQDETIENVYANEKPYNANQLLKITDIIMDEMNMVSTTITNAKKSTSIDIDQATAMNKKRQQEIIILKNMAVIKSSETKKRGSDFMLNNENNQVQYFYDIEVVKTIDFDRNNVKKKIKKLSQTCDEVSMEIEKAMIMTNVDINPKFDFTDNLEDIIEKYCK